MNFASASPRIVWEGSTKMTARAPRRGALSHCVPQLKSSMTMLPETTLPL
jgi:hypothetical protein